MSTYQIEYEECLKNVDQYINDVRALIEKKSYGHALGMAILAKEELAKAVGCFVILSGVIDVKDEAGKNFLRLLHRMHELKIGVAHLLLSVPEMLSKLKDQVGKVVRKQKEYTRKREELIRRSSEDLLVSAVVPLVSQTRDDQIPKKRRKEIQNLKLKGFYVDIDKNGAIITPNKITEEEATAQLNELERNRKIVSEVLVWPSQPSQAYLIMREVLKEFWKPIAKELEKISLR